MPRLTSTRTLTNRRATGQEILDGSLMLVLIFFAFFLPLLNFATIGLRYALVMQATFLAARAAAQCKTFQQNASETDVSAVNTASAILNQAIATWTGIATDGITTSIVTVPLSGGAISKQTKPLSKLADPNQNAYDVEVQVDAQLTPLVMVPKSILHLGTIPGLTAPIPIATRFDVTFESSQGLNQ